MNVLEMSSIASILIIATIIIRAIGLYHLPKKMFLCLWGIAVFRLLIPGSIPMPYAIPMDWQAPIRNFTTTPSMYTSPGDAGASISIVLIAWLVGICACVLFFATSYFKSYKEFRTALPVESDFVIKWLKEHPLRRTIQVCQTDRTKAPLTYGIFHPVILLPKGIDLSDENCLRYILAHEHTHIRHFDVLSKLILIITVCCHWFNPLVWIMYILANRDLELVCDEAVVKTYEQEGRSAYALTLINLEEVKSRMSIANYFSKNGAEERIVAIMKIRKYTVPIIILAVVLVGGSLTFAMAQSNPMEQPNADMEQPRMDIDSQVCSGYAEADVSPDIVTELEELNNQEFGPNDVDSPLGELVSVNRGDEGKFTAEEWDDILQKAENGDILLFDTLEDERAYFQNW